MTGSNAKSFGKLRAVTSTTSEPNRGDVIDDAFTIQGLIGRGGVGDVYLARQKHGPTGPRDVVIKMLSTRWLDDPKAVARFEREIERLRSIEHPNIVKMFDSGVSNGRPYLVMEYIDGEPLSDFLQTKGSLTLQEFVPIAAQILKAMGHVHLREMMIRDIKPANIMLCERKGRSSFVKLLDFGLAKLIHEDCSLTEGYVLGTAGYLAPEAIKGDPVDLRVDVYSIGVLFYHLLSGATPFEGQEGTTILYKTINEPVPDLRTKLPNDHDIPDGVIELIEACLAKNPDDRPADANIVVEQLIDVVPAAYFRLPRTSERSNLPGFGNTGLIELVRQNPSARFEALPRPTASLPSPNQPQPTEQRWPRRTWLAVVLTVAGLASVGTAWGLASTRTTTPHALLASASLVSAPVGEWPSPNALQASPQFASLSITPATTTRPRLTDVVPSRSTTPTAAPPTKATRDDAIVPETEPAAIEPAEPEPPVTAAKSPSRRSASKKQPSALLVAPSTKNTAPSAASTTVLSAEPDTPSSSSSSSVFLRAKEPRNERPTLMRAR